MGTRTPKDRLGKTTASDQWESTRQFLRLEEEAKHLDQTLWEPELKAMACEERVVAIWDAIRGKTNALEILASVEFSRLIVPEVAAEVMIEDEIRSRSLSGAERTMSPAEWRTALLNLARAGFELEQTEWRQIAFSTNEPPESEFTVEWHLKNASTRYQVSFELEIQWAIRENAPRFDVLRVKNGRILSRSGAPRFTPWFSMELPLVPGLETLDPFLAVYDLDHDSRPEITLVLQNMILRPRASFAPEKLCAHPPKDVHTALFGDFDHDGTVDYLCATLDALLLFRGTKEGTFPNAPAIAWKPPQAMSNPFVLTSGDIDGDGDLDIYLAQYKLPYVGGQMPTPFYDANDGFPAFLLLNDGRGSFTDGTMAHGLAAKRFRRTYSASFVDVDADHDLDLFVASDFYGADLFLNDGRGGFTDATSRLISEPHAFGMAHAFADFDLDGAMDILMIGMNSDVAKRLDSLGVNRPGFPEYPKMRSAMGAGNRLYLQRAGHFADHSGQFKVAKAGWAWGVAPFDMDGDGDVDLYIVNGHNSRATAMDYETQFWRHDIFVGKSELNPVTEMFFSSFASRLYGAGWSYGGFHKNKLFLNQGGTNFIEAGYLHGVALEEDCRNLSYADLDDDGDSDLILTTFQQFPQLRQTLNVFKNTGEPGNRTAVALDPATAPGTVIKSGSDARGAGIQYYVTGDSYRSQRPTILHLASSRTNREAMVFLPNATNATSITLEGKY